jgi:hypothetical protein
MITFIAAVATMDQDEEDLRRKKERSADAAAATAFAKVESMLTLPKEATAAKPEAKSGEVV